MENLQINETEIKTIDAVVTDIETRIARLVVNSQENLTIGGDILAEIKQEIKATEAKHDEYKKPLNLLKDKLAEVFNPRIKQLKALKNMIEKNMLPYQLKIIKEREEFAAEARKKELVLIQERADAALAEAAKTNSEVKLNTAIDIAEYKAEVEAREIKGHARTTGGMGQMTSGKEWKHKITNDDLVPRDLCSSDDKKIKEWIKTNKDNLDKKLKSIPGIEFYETVINRNL
jgi:hypothetical protein